MNFFGMRFLIACCAFASALVQAECTLDYSTGAGPPVTFSVPSQVLSISADMPVDTSAPFATIITPPAGTEVNYINCPPDVTYGGVPINLRTPDGNNMFPTNIDGIGMKIGWDNGSNRKDIPFMRVLHEIARMVYPAGSYYVIDFFKTADTVKLIPNQDNVILDSGDISYGFIGANSIANFAQKLNVGMITINSTPACTFESTKNIDFNTVTPSMADSGVERPLNFEMNCRTDYGQYSVLASIIADARTSDSKYISVTDAGGNTDRLRIEIKDNEGANIAVDGTSLRRVTSSDNVPAQFKWTATLSSFGQKSKRPTGGKFDARAEIVLQVN